MCKYELFATLSDSQKSLDQYDANTRNHIIYDYGNLINKVKEEIKNKKRVRCIGSAKRDHCYITLRSEFVENGSVSEQWLKYTCDYNKYLLSPYNPAYYLNFNDKLSPEKSTIWLAEEDRADPLVTTLHEKSKEEFSNVKCYQIDTFTIGYRITIPFNNLLISITLSKDRLIQIWEHSFEFSGNGHSLTVVDALVWEGPTRKNLAKWLDVTYHKYLQSIDKLRSGHEKACETFR